MIYSSIYYIQTNVICILLFVLILFMQKKHSRVNTTETVLLNRLIFLTMIYCVSDVGAWLSNGVSGLGGLFILTISNIVYITLPAIFIFIWLQYVYYKLYNLELIKTVVGKVLFIPLAFIVLSSVFNPFTRFLFSVDSDNIYHRGFGSYLLPAICLSYLLFSVFIIWRYVKTEDNKVKVDETYPMMMFCLPILAATGIQLIFYGLTVAQLGFTTSILMLYFSIQYGKISVDELTGLNNRRELRQYLYGMYNSEKTDNMFICMIDVDFFKTINDTYGHLEGDLALKNVSRVLKEVCGMQKRRCFLARYGGDEFIIAGINSNLHELDTIKHQLITAIKEENESSDKTYRLSLSIGYSLMNIEDLSGYEQLLKNADEEMYRVKKLRAR